MDKSGTICGDEKKPESIHAPELINMVDSTLDSPGKLHNTDIFSDHQNGDAHQESDHVSSCMTLGPNLCDQKDLQPIGYHFDLSSSGGNDCIEDSLSSSSDSHYESFNSSDIPGSSFNGGHHSVIERDTEHLVAEYEEKLKFSNQKQKIWEEEMVKLKDEKNSQENDMEMQRRVVMALQKKIIDLEACICDSDYEKQELVGELEANREKLSESNEQVEKLKQECKDEISKTTFQFQSQLDLAWSNVDLLEAQVSNLHDRIEKSSADINSRDDEIGKLKEDFNHDKAQLCAELEESREENAKLKTSKENLKVEFQSHIEQLETEHGKRGVASEDLKLKLDKLTAAFTQAEEDSIRDKARLCAKLEESMKENAELKTSQENLKVDFQCQIEQLEAEHKRREVGFEDLKLKMDRLNAAALSQAEEDSNHEKAQLCAKLKESMKVNAELATSQENLKIDFQCHIEQLDVEQKKREQGFEDLELKLDELAKEIDELVSKTQREISEMDHKDMRIKELEDKLHQLQNQSQEIISKYEASMKVSGELKCQVERQNVVICEGEENKREAIRQLCFALEHYRIEHMELRKATMLVRNKNGALKG